VCERVDRLFFFSSRRRHTRCLSDWSSDVCSSDLTENWKLKSRTRKAAIRQRSISDSESRNAKGETQPHPVGGARRLLFVWHNLKIGRASCRERVSVAVVAGAVHSERLSSAVTSTR